MPKRMTVTEKWNDEWFLSLSPQAKVIWEYVLDNCDLCGVFEINIELLRFRIRFSPQVDVISHFHELNECAKKIGIDDRVEWFEGNRRIWVRNFIKVQYGVLSEKSSTHRGVLKVIDNHKHTKGLPKGLQTLIGVVKVKNKNKYLRSKVKEVKEPNIPFETFWNAYDKKLDKDKCVESWGKLTDEEREHVMKFIPDYVKSQPIKQYRKNPQTFLNNKSWNDEIIPADVRKNGSAVEVHHPSGPPLKRIS